jgi:hypothetical protein
MAKPGAVLTARELRWFGETADGLRNVDLALARMATGGFRIVNPANAGTGKHEVLAAVRTGDDGPGLQTKVQVVIRFQTQDGKTSELDVGPDVDALFLTQSALRKFLLPYYMRMLSAAQVQGMENRFFNNADVVAVAHEPPSDSYALFTSHDAVCADPVNGLTRKSLRDLPDPMEAKPLKPMF